MSEPNSELPGTIKLLAWAGGAIITLLVPLAFLAIGYNREAAGLEVAAEISQQVVKERFRPGFKTSPAGLREALRSLEWVNAETLVRILADDQVLAEKNAGLSTPLVTRRAPLHVGSDETLHLEMSRSIRPLLMYSVAMLAPGLLLGWVTFIALSIMPMRAFQLALREIATRKAAEERLEKSLSLFSATLEATTDGIFATDASGKAIVSSQRFLDMWNVPRSVAFGRNEVEALGILAAQLRDPTSFFAKQRELTKLTELEHTQVIELRDGRIFEWNSRPQRVEGKVVGRVSSFRDISESKRAHALLSAEKQVLQMVVRGDPLVAGLSVLAGHVEVLSGQMFCSILFRENPGEGRLVCATGRSLPARVSRDISERSQKLLPELFSDAQTQEEENVNVFRDIGSEPGWAAYRDMMSAWGVAPCFAVAVRSSAGLLLGLIIAHYRTVEEQQDQDLELTRVAANLTSIAIERRQSEARLEIMAHYDALTLLPNRVLFRDRLNRALARADRNNELVALMFLDLDRFKTINDTLGHDAGDVLLREVSIRLRNTVREEDSIARLGGDEFTVMLEQLEKSEDAAVVASKIIESLSPPVVLGGQETFVTPSIGITIYPLDSSDAENLIRNADTAMYKAKQEGGNNYRFFSPTMNAKTLERLKMESGLRRALERGEFIVYYQPKLELSSDRIVGAEALLRWKHPEWGLVSPAEFIPILEETGLIEPVGEWVLRDVCKQTRTWNKAVLPPLCVAVNLSGRQLQRNNLAATIAGIIEETGIDPRLLELEVTESMLMHNPEYAADMLTQIRARGVVSIEVDDFGTGYSSLSYLKRFPIDALKLDRSFVRGLPHDDEDVAITNAVIALAHSLKLKVIAEGVETGEQLEFLRRAGCHMIQGYIISEPLPAEAFAELVREHGPGNELPPRAPRLRHRRLGLQTAA